MGTSGRPRPGKKTIYAVAGLSVVVAVGWIAGAAYSNHAADGGRGGAIGVALTFAILFLQRGGVAQEELERKNPPAAPGAPAPRETPEQTMQRLLNAFTVYIEAQTEVTLPLILASTISTLAWGFGDFLATWIRMALLHANR